MKVLVACEFSGIVRTEFEKIGHDALSCDLLPTEIPGSHYQGDVKDILYFEKWDLIIAHPPCTYLCNSGVPHLYTQKGRWELMRAGAEFFKRFLELKCRKIAVENPIPHKYALEIIGRKYDQKIQPYQFGHPESKATCLWLKGLPKLEETENVKSEMQKLPKNQQQRIYHLPPGKDRAKLRSKTFTGIAKAMAEQWG
ncbi:phage related protein [Methanococcus maripaludis X1]|uniref:Phage related protein n=1 Tax=Methanococcus maripaludis X1 TaxID=1053692 RepID=G0H435_METMI|nr:hypothetical protein [Methanococcus maripaludis]AEK19501.1 phage related protein [Methanococcus maripaludis X1]